MTEAIALIPATFDDAMKLARSIAPSALLPVQLRGKEAEVFMQILAGRELGLPPMASIRGFHVIEGVPRLTADTMVAIVLKSSLCEYVRPVETTEQRCTWEAKRRDHPEPTRYSWSMEEQKRIGWKDGSGWAKYPKRMMSARAKSFLVRDLFPELLAGIISAEEAEDEVGSATRANAIDAVFTEAVVASAAAPPTPPSEADQSTIDIIANAIRDAESEGEVKRIIKDMAKEAPAVREALKPLMKARLEEVRLAAKLEAEHAATQKDGQP